MRLKNVSFNLTLKMRLLMACFVWACVGVVAFFNSETGKNFTEWSRQMWLAAEQKSGRSLQQIKVVWQNSANYTKNEEILKTIGVNRGEPMANIDLNQIKERIEKMPWIRSVIVERYWPNTIKLTIKEKVPIAIWQNKHRYHPLDEHAEVIGTTDKMPADFLLVVGPDAPKHLISLIQDLEKVPEIYQYVRAAVRVNERRWNLELFSVEKGKGLEVALPDTGVLEALQRLEEHNKNEKLIKRQVAFVDLRTKGKVVLQPIEVASFNKKVKKK